MQTQDGRSHQYKLGGCKLLHDLTRMHCTGTAYMDLTMMTMHHSTAASQGAAEATPLRLAPAETLRQAVKRTAPYSALSTPIHSCHPDSCSIELQTAVCRGLESQPATTVGYSSQSYLVDTAAAQASCSSRHLRHSTPARRLPEPLKKLIAVLT